MPHACSSYIFNNINIGLVSSLNSEKFVSYSYSYTYSQLLNADTPQFRTPAIMDKIQSPDESYIGLSDNDSRYYGLSLLRNYGL